MSDEEFNRILKEVMGEIDTDEFIDALCKETDEAAANMPDPTEEKIREIIKKITI